MGTDLQRIQEVQFTDRARAEQMLRLFTREVFGLDVTEVELTVSAVSLNSLNGFLTLREGRRLFFKTHTETDTIINEYYNSALLEEAEYPVLRPLYSSTEVERQILVYEAVQDPSVFDVAWAIEQGRENAAVQRELTHAQHESDRQLLGIYRKTLNWQAGEQAGEAPIHQLFHHRLTKGRLDRFLGAGKTLTTPAGRIAARELRKARWVVNGRRYAQTLDDLIREATAVLEPRREGPSVIGHGDAHNGNLFFRRSSGSLQFFDPAFAGRHDPVLDLAKPLFHNVFASWMYYPEVKRAETTVRMEWDRGEVRLDHDYRVHPVRLMFLDSKVRHTLVPLLRELRQRDWLRADWRRFLKCALFCCPLLTVDLSDTDRIPPEIGMLGLAMAVEMGGTTHGITRSGESLLDSALDEVQRAIGRG